MKFFGNEEKEVKVATERKLEYLRCDRCHKKIEENQNNPKLETSKRYFYVVVYHYFYDEDNVDNFQQHFDICEDCIDKFIREYLLDENNIDYNIEIKTKWFAKHFESYDKNESFLIDEDYYKEEN